MGKPQRHALECRTCGLPRKHDGDMSCTGQCPACGETALVENIRGLTDPQSVPYKQWRIAWSVSHYGRPAKSTPPPGWIPRTSSLQMRSVIPGRHS